MSQKIPLFKIYWDRKDVKAVVSALQRGRQWAIGPEVEKLENELAKYLGVRYAVSFNSGTSALHALMMAYGIGKGDEVIVPSFTFIATANAPLFVGAKPVFADIEEDTLGLDPADVIKKITQKTKAIIPIHYAGSGCKIELLKNIARKHNLILIEDAAESLGARIKNRKVGTFGDSAIFSFCQNKIATSGEGGAATTNSEEIYDKLKLIRSHGREEGNYFESSDFMDYIALGYNFRLSNILASLALSQLGKIGKLIKMRRKNAEYLIKNLSVIKDLILPIPPKDYLHIYQMFTLRVKNGRKKRDALLDYLNKKGIMAKIYFDPVHSTSFYKNKLGYKVDLPITKKITGEVLTLPFYPGLSPKEMDYMVREIKAFFKQNE